MLPALRAGGERIILHALFDFKFICAAFTLVLIDRHYSFPPAGPVCLVLLVCFVYLVDLVQLVSFIQPNKRDKPNKPTNGFLLLSELLERLVKAIHSTDNRLHTGRV